MAGGSRTQNTMAEGLHSLLGQIAAMKAAPDADLNMLSQFEAGVLQAIKQPQQQALAQFAQSGGALPPEIIAQLQGMGGPPGMGGGPPQMQSPTGNGQGMRGVPPAAALPPVDELRRLMSSGTLA